MTTTDTIKGKINEAEEMARKIWLAGLGAYGKSVEEAQGRYEKLSEEANKMFDELVTKGETLEEDAKSKFKSTTNDVENRVADVRKKLGLDSEPADQRIEELVEQKADGEGVLTFVYALEVRLPLKLVDLLSAAMLDFIRYLLNSSPRASFISALSTLPLPSMLVVEASMMWKIWTSALRGYQET